MKIRKLFAGFSIVAALPFSCVGAHAAPFAYLAAQSGAVYVVDVADNTLVTTLQAGNGAFGATVSPDAKRVYVGAVTSSNISVFDLPGNTFNSSVSNISAAGIAFDPGGNLAYVANIAANSLVVLGTSPFANAVFKTIPVGTAPAGVAISPDGSRVYLSNIAAGSVSVVAVSATNPASDAVIATIPLGTGSQPGEPAVSPDGTKVYVPTQLMTGTSYQMAVINVDQSGVPTLGTPIEVGGQGAAAFDPTGRCAYVTGPGGVSVVDVAHAMMIGNIVTGGQLIGIALTRDGRYIEVANIGNGTASKIDTAAARVVSTLTLAPGAQAFAYGQFITPEATDNIFANDFGICGL